MDFRFLFAYDESMRANAMVWLSQGGRWHSHCANGRSLFEVAGWALAHFVVNGYLTSRSMADAMLCVQTAKGKTYRVRTARIQRWLAEEPAEDFRSRLVKEQIWKTMTRR